MEPRKAPTVKLLDVFPTVKCFSCGGNCRGVSGHKFRQLREAGFGLSQREVSRATGYSYTLIQDLEHGRRKVSAKAAERLLAWALAELEKIRKEEA